MLRWPASNSLKTIVKASPSSSTALTCRRFFFGKGKSERNSWFYFTENELTPGAARVGNYKAVFNLRGDNGEATGGLAVDTNLGWKGPEKYVATVPQVFDLWQDPQERYDIFMNNYTERTWTLVTINEAITNLMKTYLKYPPRKLQSEAYSGPITISQYERFAHVRESRKKWHQYPAAHRQLNSSWRDPPLLFRSSASLLAGRAINQFDGIRTAIRRRSARCVRDLSDARAISN